MVQDPIVDELALEVCNRHAYKFVRACDAGAFKKTYHVTGGNKDIALKLIVGDISAERVQREIEALQVVDHPHISRLLHVDTIERGGKRVVYLLEEFLSGGTLAHRIEKDRLPLADGCTLAIAMTDALEHLESRGLVHRDIKPANIMYRGNDAPVLVDLGIARHVQASSITHTWLARGPGTPAYAAPEQLVNDKPLISWRTDQFSLGITLSIALIGMHPYSGDESLEDVVERAARREPPAQAFIDAAEFLGLDVLVRMVQPWPIKRFTRPADLRRQWEAIRIIS